MKYDTIVVSLLRKSDKILDGFGCVFWKKFESDISEIRGEENFWVRHRLMLGFRFQDFASLFFVWKDPYRATMGWRNTQKQEFRGRKIFSQGIY